MLKKLSIAATTLLLATSISTVHAESYRKAGQWYFAWGWNNADYSESDIEFEGDDHNFTLKDVEAEDRQSDVEGGGWLDDFLNPGRISIPQTNLRVGYFLTDNVSLSFVIDHMKYVVVEDQTVEIEGEIQGTTQSGTQVLTEDFLRYEHTDGLNYIALEGEYYRSFWQPVKGIDFSWVAGGGAGVLYPRTNVTLLDREKNDEFHYSGYGYALKAGVEISFLEDFFFRYMIKHGHINMPDVVTSSEGDKAAQEFDFTEYLGVFGYRF
ncbi:hypothetical protein A9Q99_25805 [Gammaproteobacteria bacterium 45_16_T64]|nr:hypothetical protein A9Q99_25805 [Gammaproteobacteria bacterium 45_16_T64]